MKGSPVRGQPSSTGRMSQVVSVESLQGTVENRGRQFVYFAIAYYICIPALYYWATLGWEGVDAFYFAIVTFSTVGYGDILPTTKGQKLATAFFILGGVAITANLVGVINSMLSKRQWDAARERRLAKAEIHAKEYNCFALIYLGYREMLSYFRKVFDKVTGFQVPPVDVPVIDMSSSTESGCADSAAKDLRILTNALSTTVQDKKYLACVDFAFIWILVLVGTLMMPWIENFTYHDAFYWSVVTLTTVGYGDIVPTSYEGKIFAMFFIAFGTILLGKTISDFIMAPIEIRGMRNEIKVIEQFERHLTMDLFHELIQHPFCIDIKHFKKHKREFTKAEFMLIMLSIMNKVADDDVQTAGRIFDRYDMDGDGTLSQDELGSHLESDVGRSGNKRRMSFSEAVMTVVNSMRHEQDHAPLTENSNIEDGQSHAPYVEMM